MRRSIISMTVLAALALPASALAANSITVNQVVAPDSTAIADASGSVDVPCSEANCRWYVQVALANTTADCPTTNRVVFMSDLQPPGSGTVPFALRYGTPAGPRPEVACLRVYDTRTQGSRVLAMFEYPVPAVGGRFTAASPAPAPSSSPLTGAGDPGPRLARDFSLFRAGRALHNSMKRRFGRTWIRAERRVDCNASSTRSYRCVIQFNGRTLTARVRRLASGGIGITYGP